MPFPWERDQPQTKGMVEVMAAWGWCRWNRVPELHPPAGQGRPSRCAELCFIYSLTGLCYIP